MWRSRLSRLLTAASLLAALLLGLAWWRSASEMEIRKGPALGATIQNGWLRLYLDWFRAPTGQLIWWNFAAQFGAVHDEYYSFPRAMLHNARVSHERTFAGLLKYPDSAIVRLHIPRIGDLGIGESHASTTWIGIPVWLAEILLLILPAFALRRRIQRPRNLPARPCSKCGYDLQGHSSQPITCPECGTQQNAHAAPTPAAPTPRRWPSRILTALTRLSAAAFALLLFLTLAGHRQSELLYFDRNNAWTLAAAEGQLIALHTPNTGNGDFTCGIKSTQTLVGWNDPPLYGPRSGQAPYAAGRLRISYAAQSSSYLRLPAWSLLLPLALLPLLTTTRALHRFLKSRKTTPPPTTR